MAVFKVIAKNQLDINKKPRVYFTCHPDDFEKYFKKICDDIFKTHDCAIYYTEDMSEKIAEDEKTVDLGRNNLFVVPVTFKLLSTPNRAIDEDIPYALNEHIHIIPFMMETGIDEIYSKIDRFGELHYLNPYSTDITEISYEDKLKKHLESVLISDELAKRIRAAFDAYIFLSYRKKDRKYANELMKLIHRYPECRDIAIWFDEFLTPGESFKEIIENILNDCKLFTLLITPNLLEKVIDADGNEVDNYVISTELPLARKKKEENGTGILAVEMEKTDEENLASINIEDYVSHEDELFRERLLETISKIIRAENNTAEHNFLIGLAYLEGIDVEVDRERGIELITYAAESGLLEAMVKLYDIHYRGIGTNVDYSKAVYWAEKMLEYSMQHYGEENVNTLATMNGLALAYCECGNVKKALELHKKVYMKRCELLGSENRHTLVSMNNLAYTYAKCGNIKKALELYEKVLKKQKIYGEENSEFLISLSNLAITYGELGDRPKEIKLQERAYKLSGRINGESHRETFSSMRDLAFAYSRNGDHEKALELMEKLYELRRAALGEEHPDTLETLNNLAYEYGECGKHKKALELQKKVYESSVKMFGEDHPNALIALNNLALTYTRLGAFQQAVELNEKKYKLCCVVYGTDNLETMESLNDLAYSYCMIGNYKRTFELLKNLYKKRCQVFGEADRDTINILYNLIRISSLTGDRAAEIIYKAKLKNIKKTD